VPFMPWVCTHAARLEQLSLQRMLSDPSLLARAIQGAHKLYGYDLVSSIFDPAIEAEACGCPIRWTGEKELPRLEDHPPIDQMSEAAIASIRTRGRLPVVLEATQRLKINLGRTVAIAGVVTGPWTLANHLNGSDILQDLESHPERAKDIVDLAGKVCLEVCKAYAEIELDLIVLADSVLPRVPLSYSPLTLSVLNPLLNVIRFYDSVPLLLTRGCSRESLDLLAEIEVDGVVVDGNMEPELRQKMPHCAVGRAIPGSALKGPEENLIVYLKGCLTDAQGQFISTEWQVPYDTPPENIHRIMKSIRGA
jgi:uroporphyrinogen decarboxylase